MILPIFALIAPLLVSSASVPSDNVDLCKNLKPKETTSYFARGKGPYSMTLTPNAKEKVIDVHLSASEGNHFQGYMVQARNGTAPIGKFTKTDNANSIDCGNLPQSSIAQSENSKKTSVHLKWEIPAGLPKGTTILFKASITKQFLEYHVIDEAIKI